MGNEKGKRDQTDVLKVGTRNEPKVPEFEFEEGKTQIIEAGGNGEPVDRWIRASLVLLHGPNAGNEYVVNKPKTLFGRGEEVDIKVLSNAVSKVHTELLYRDNCFSARDLGSRNGTFVNGIRIGKSPVELKHGDKLTLGDVTFQFLFELKTPVAEFDLSGAGVGTPSDIGRFVPGESTPERLRSRIRDVSAFANRIVDSFSSGVVITDLNLGVVTGNLGFMKMFTFKDAAEIRGREIASLLPWLAGSADLLDLAGALAFSRERGVQLPKLEAKLHYGQRILKVKVFGMEALRRDASVEHVVFLFEDITEEERLLAQTEAHRKQLFQADKLSLLGTLSTGISHEINNCIGFMRSNLDLLRVAIEGGSLNTEQARGMLSELYTGIEQATGIAQSVTRFSYPGEEEKLGPVSVNDAIRNAVKTAMPELRTKARLAENLQQASPVSGSQVRLEQVFLNLLLNAAQAFSEGGPETNTIEVRSRTEGRSVVVEVSDNGRGIAKESLDKIFKPFFTTKEHGKAAGLGLSLVSEIVEMHLGKIEVESELGKGTLFRVILPALE